MAVDAARAKSLFLAASDLSDPAQRAVFLERECGGDAELRARVEALLRANDAAPLPTVDSVDGPPRTADYPDPTARAGTVIAGKYTLVEAIGQGGMGSVWRARQTEPVKRYVAVKLIKAGMDSKAVLARFEAERQALALMDHPNIARVLDGGVVGQAASLPGQAGSLSHGGRPFFVMELVKGTPITQFCDERKLTPRQRLELFVPVCQAIQHAHQKGVIHRDIKPSNVLIALYDDRPVPKVIDFGVAKATGAALTERTIDTGFGGVVGTPQYMSPEQATFNNLDIDTRSDVYALGILLYELLAGSPPFGAKELEKKGLLEILRVVREEEPPRPSIRLSTAEALPTLSANRGTEPKKLTGLLRYELDWIVMKALEKDRTRRYETANGLAADVGRYLAGEPVQAYPPSTAYRLRKFVRRYKGQVIAASLVLFALLAGMAGTTLGLIEARKQEAEAKKQADLARDEALAKEQARADEQTQREKAEQAAEAEKAAKEQTQKRLAQIEKGVELFAGLVRGLNPRAEEQGAPPLYEQLRQRAAKAADELVGEAVGDPEAVARLQTLLGETLLELGDAAKAVEVLERARVTREAKLGADHADTLSTLHDLARAFQAAGKLPEAIALFEQVRDAEVKKLGADHHDTLATLNNLAGAYYAAGKLPQAIALFERVRDARVKNLGADHPDTLTTLNNLAEAYRAAGKLPEAVALFEQVRDAQVKKLGADHPDTLTTLNNLAVAYRAAGKLPQAIALYEQVRDTLVKKLGVGHPHTLITLNNLAVAYRAAGKLPQAIALFAQVRDAKVKKLGADHPSTLTTLNNLAGAYQAAGRLPEAIALFEQAAAGIEKRRFQHEYAARIIPDTAAAYEQAKQLDKAEAWRRKWLAVVKDRAGADSADYASELAALGLNLLQQKKWTEAETALAECLAIREKQQPEAWTTFNTQSLLGGALSGQARSASKGEDKESLARAAGLYRQAEPLLLKGYEGMKQREKTIPPQGAIRIPEALDRLIDLYTATNKPDEAKKWQAERAKYRPPSNEVPPLIK